MRTGYRMREGRSCLVRIDFEGTEAEDVESNELPLAVM